MTPASAITLATAGTAASAITLAAAGTPASAIMLATAGTPASHEWSHNDEITVNIEVVRKTLKARKKIGWESPIDLWNIGSVL